MLFVIIVKPWQYIAYMNSQRNKVLNYPIITNISDFNNVYRGKHLTSISWVSCHFKSIFIIEITTDVINQKEKLDEIHRQK